MRSFIASALVIAAVLIGQQLVTRSSEARDVSPAPAHSVTLATGAADWLAGKR